MFKSEYFPTDINLSNDTIAQAVDTITTEWKHALKQTNHPAHLELLPRPDINASKNSFKDVTVIQTAHLPKIIDDLIIRPIWQKVMRELDDNPAQREDWKFTIGNSQPILHSSGFTQHHSTPQYELDIFADVVHYIHDKIDTKSAFPKEFYRYGATQTNKFNVLNLGQVTADIISGLEGIAINQLTTMSQFGDMENLGRIQKGLANNARLTSKGYEESLIPIGYTIPIEEAKLSPIDRTISKSKRISKNELEFANEEFIFTELIRADLTHKTAQLNREQLNDEIQFYFTGPQEIMNKREPLSVFYTGILFPNEGCTNEESTAFYASKDDFHLSSDSLGDGLPQRELSTLAAELYKMHITWGEKKTQKHIRKAGSKYEIVKTHDAQYVPEVEILPFPHIHAFQNNYMKRILNGITPVEEAQRDPFFDAPYEQHRPDDDIGI